MYLLDTRLNFVPSAYIFSANLRIRYTSPWHSASLLPDDQDTNLLLLTSRILCPFSLPFLVDASSPRFPIISHERADFFGRETDGGGRGAPSLSNAIFGNLALPPSLLPFKKCLRARSWCPAFLSLPKIAKRCVKSEVAPPPPLSSPPLCHHWKEAEAEAGGGQGNSTV